VLLMDDFLKTVVDKIRNEASDLPGDLAAMMIVMIDEFGTASPMMIEGQTGWIVPAKPGLFLVQGMIDNMHSDESKTEDYLNSLLSSAIG
jgi:hypothetical protein